VVRRALLFLYLGFAVGTLLCALAPNHVFFVLARIVAGAFAGIMGATVFAIIGDVIPYERRGAATGVVMSAFSVASIVGVPFGIFLANQLSWHAPFLLLAGLSAGVWVLGFNALPPMRGHLDREGKRDTLGEMRHVLTEPNHLRAFLLSIVLMFAGFSVIPYMSAYMVSNAGLPETQLPYIYLVGGAFTLVSARLVGRLADRFGKPRVFMIMACVSILPTVIVTNLPVVPVAVLLAVSTMFMITMSGRMIPAMAMITGSVEPRYRGSFMSVNSSIQQLGSGGASLLGGMIIVQNADGSIGGYPWVGALASVFTVAAILLVRRLHVPDSRA
jgi:predicted MFS family arabinose efflux permease